MAETPTPTPSPGPPVDEEQPLGGTGNTPETDDADQKATPYDRLRILLRRRQRAIEAGARDVLRDINKRIERLLENHSNNQRLLEEAEGAGFNIARVERPAEQPTSGQGGTGEGGGGTGGSGGSGGGSGGGGGGNAPNLRAQARDNRLLDGGRLRRTDGGMYVNEYVYKIGGETVRVGIKLGKNPDRLSRYGLKASDAKVLTKAQSKRIKSIGWADELAPHIRKGDKHVLKSLTRYLRNQYGGQAILEDDEVMSVVIANSMFGWSAGEFENKLRNTSWYKNTNAYQREWVTTVSPKEKRERTSSTFQEVINALEDNYGRDWVKYVEGGMSKAREWAETIASGKWGTPDQGLAFWAERQFDKAKLIEGTPAWITEQQEQEATRAYNNRPEDMFETLRSQAMNYLGQTRGKPLIDRETLMGWATDLVTETRSDADWQQFLRRQMRQLHPYFDENLSFTEQASPYKSIAESIVGTTLTWDDEMFMQIAGTDDKGKSTGQARSLHDFAQYVRDNDPRFWDNPQTEEKARAFGQELLSIMGGV